MWGGGSGSQTNSVIYCSGKAFSAVATVENGSPIFASLVFATIYSASVTTFPGLAFIICAVMQIPCLLAFAWIHMADSQEKHYDYLVEPGETEDDPESVTY